MYAYLDVALQVTALGTKGNQTRKKYRNADAIKFNFNHFII